MSPVDAYEAGSCGSSGIKYLPKSDDDASRKRSQDRKRRERRDRDRKRRRTVKRLADEV